MILVNQMVSYKRMISSLNSKNQTRHSPPGAFFYSPKSENNTTGYVSNYMVDSTGFLTELNPRVGKCPSTSRLIFFACKKKKKNPWFLFHPLHHLQLHGMKKTFSLVHTQISYLWREAASYYRLCPSPKLPKLVHLSHRWHEILLAIFLIYKQVRSLQGFC